MKKIVIPLAVVFMIIVVLCIYVQDQDAVVTIGFDIRAGEDVHQSINLFRNQGKLFAFLPSYADLNSISLRNDGIYRFYLNGRHYENGSILQDLAVGQDYTIEIRTPFGITVCEETLVFSKSGNIPTLSIDLIDGTVDDLHKDKSVKKTGTLSLIDDNAKIDFVGAFESISGRGNTTWSQDKKPYNLEFETDTTLLGMRAVKKYCLLANACDESNLRNKLAYDMADAMNTAYSVDSEFVDLYIDGVYYGLYLLTQSVEVSPNVVDIADLEQLTTNVNQYPLTKYDTFESIVNGVYQKGFQIQNNPSDITNGYLVEFEMAERLVNDKSGFITRGEESFYIKAPEHASAEQVEYISALFQKAEDALDQEDVGSYIDLDSVVRVYLVHEMMANTDIGSFFFCKGAGNLLVAGPVWDCDHTLGQAFLGHDQNPDAFYVNTIGWFDKIYQNPVFLGRVKKIYTDELKDIVNELLDSKLEGYCNQIQDAYFMNQQRWNGIQSYDWAEHFDTLTEHKEALSDFLKQRVDFLDSAWIDGVDYCRIYYKSEGPIYDKSAVSVKSGDQFGELPELTCEGYQFLGYFDVETGESYDPTAPISENQFLVAKWARIKANQSDNAQYFSLSKLILDVLHEVYYNLEVYCAMGLFGIMFIVVIIGGLRDIISLRRSKDDG